MRKRRLKKKVKVVLACICLTILACTLLFIKAKATGVNQNTVQKVNRVALRRATEVPVLAKVEEALSEAIEEAEVVAIEPITIEASENNTVEKSFTEVAQEDIQEAVQEPVQEPVQDQVQEVVPQEAYQAPTYNQSQLTPSAGVFYGPSGKETYYNLDMSGVIALANASGIYGDYWIRSDGVKMMGTYVMCACSFDIRPRGTIVETSLGTGICIDTGTFAESNQTQIDIAVNW